jgi:cytochrome P450
MSTIPSERRLFSVQQAFANGNPYADYAWFREHDPVHFGEPDWPQGLPAVSLFRFDDVNAILKNPNVGVEGWRLAAEVRDPDEPAPEATPYGAVARKFMLFNDPPDHTRLRRVANMAFTPRQVAKLRPDIERIAQDLVSAMLASDQPIDLIRDFSYPLPVLVIGKILGVPEVDLPKFRHWASVLAASIDFEFEELAELQEQSNQSALELYEYLSALMQERKAEPKDDLVSQLVQAETDDGRMGHDELVATAILLLFAGHETTTNLIGNGTLAMLHHPEQWELLVNDPSLATPAVEELLRYESPVQLTTRVAFADIEVGGVTIPRGTQNLILLGSANRDPAVFDDPDRLDIRRDVKRTMAFGMGIHFCLGSPLARMEGEIAFDTLVRTVPTLRLLSETPNWRPGAVLHGLRELPVAL